MRKIIICLLICVCALSLLCVGVSAEECDHNWVLQEGTVPATCTAPGSEPYKCSRCEATKTEELTKLDHDWVEQSRTPATCAAPGSIEEKCSLCDLTRSIPIEQLTHIWVETSRTEATCNDSGSVSSKCSLCNETKTETLDKLGHDFSVFISTSATCTAKGQTTYKCSRCSEITLEDVTALGHDYEKSGGPTCTASGKYTYTCKRCGNKYTDTKTTKALGHDVPDEDSADWKLYKKATCETVGSKRCKCARCKTYVYIDIPKTDHEYGDIYLIKAPTKTYSGKAEYICEDCGKTESVTVAKGTTSLSKYTVPTVTASVKTSTVKRGTEITFDCELSGATIYYALDGKSPLTKSYRIEFDPDEPLVITDTTTVRVYATYSGVGSADIASFVYTVRSTDSWVHLGESASKGGYMKLENGKKFRPDDKATRYEVIESLDSLFDSYAESSATVFSDVDTTHKKSVAKFTGAKLLDGYDDGTFRGKANIKRSEFSKVLAIALGLDTTSVITTAFTDVAKTHWAYKYITALTKAGYLKGDTDGTFRPEDNITRAELVTVMNRVAGVEDADGVEISDISETHWAYKKVCAAVK